LKTKKFLIVTIFLLLVITAPLEFSKIQAANGDDQNDLHNNKNLQTSYTGGSISGSVSLQAGMIKLVGESKPGSLTGEVLGSHTERPLHKKDVNVFNEGKVQLKMPISPETREHKAPMSTRPLGPVPQQSTSVFGFDGLNEVSSGFYYPPDVQVATGSGNVTEMVNLEGKIFKKDGTSITSFSLSAFFLAGTDSLSDPKVLYDSISGRWFASITDITTGNVLLAVSTTTDPTKSWVIYSVPFAPSPNPCADFADQPILGLNDDKVVVSGNIFENSCTGSFVGAEYFVLDKSALVAGSSTVNAQVFGPDPSLFSVHPVHSLSSTPSLYMVSVGDGGTSQVQLFTISGSVPSATVTITSLPILAANIPPDARQLGTSMLLATGDARIQDAEWFQGNLWLTFTDACIPSGDTQTRSCAHLTEISTSSSPATVIQDFRYGVSTYYYYYPALAADGSGNLNLIFGYSSSSTYPSLAITGQYVGETSGTLLQSLVLKAGQRPDTSARYGDYFGAGVDPSATGTVWVAGEYHSSSFSSAYWSSFIGTTSIPLLLKSTTLTLNPISSVPWGTTVTVTGKLTNSTTGTGIGGKTITFTGTGATNLVSVVTKPDGTFSSSGLAPSTVQSGWTVQAHFAGDSNDNPSDSSVVKYNTAKHGTALTLSIGPSTVVHGSAYQVNGTLTDNITHTKLASQTITFTATSPITISSTTTDSTGKYIVTGLVAPTPPGSYQITSHFASTTLYGASNSPTRTLTVT